MKFGLKCLDEHKDGAGYVRPVAEECERPVADACERIVAEDCDRPVAQKRKDSHLSNKMACNRIPEFLKGFFLVLGEVLVY